MGRTADTAEYLPSEADFGRRDFLHRLVKDA
jgi:hypothetical protein